MDSAGTLWYQPADPVVPAGRSQQRPPPSGHNAEMAASDDQEPYATSGEQAHEEGYTHVRVLCLDSEGCLLLMKWRDPVDGHETWEPPGGGVEVGESLVQAAVRELREETGISVEIRDRYVLAHRDDRWKGRPRRRLEPCFFAAVGDAEVEPQIPTAEERDTLVEWRFVRHDELGRLDASVYPGDPFALVGELLA